MKSKISYWIGQTFLAIIRSVLHLVMSILHRRQGKAVPPVKNPLLLKSASALARDIREGKCKSEDVIQAYINRIQEVEPYINATAELCFQDALRKARKVDELIASGKYSEEQIALEKPLLGVPFSVKGLTHVKNMPLTAGCHYFSFKVEEDAPVVSAMKKAGAIVIATTNVPELAANIETSNKYYGTTSNPYDTDRTCGGSSGGEGALISAGGSVLGLGNDLLGSLRIPAHFTGIFAHKPSRGLVSTKKVFPFEKPGSPMESSRSDAHKYYVNGPMCRYAEDLITSMKVLSLDNEVRMKFDHQVDFKSVKVRYLTEIYSPLIAPVEQDIADGLKKAVSYFEKQYDIEPQEVKMPYLFDVNNCITNVIAPVISDLKALTIGHKGLGLNGRLEFAKCLFGKSKLCLATFFYLNCESNPLIYRKNSSYSQKMIETWTDEFNKLLDENTILLIPTLPVTAPYHLESFPILFSLCYVSLFNILGLPATHCPLGLTQKGLPYGIQVVGCQNNDPLTIACAVELEKAFGGWKPF